MPFRHAHWLVLGLFPLAGVAFWPNYLSQMGSAPPSFHFHGMTASLWLILLAIQSWSIHHGRRAFHKTNGLISFALFPLFLAGGAAIFVGMAQRFAAPPSEFYTLYAPRLAWLDFVAIAGLAWFYFQALKHRRDVGKHSAHMLATAIFLLPPILGRLAPIPMGVHPGLPDFYERLYAGFHWGNIVTALIAFLIAWRAGRNGRPFVLAGLLTLAASLLFEVPGGTDAWRSIYAGCAALPLWPMVVAAGLFGAAVGWAGWRAGKRGVAPVDPGALPV